MRLSIGILIIEKLLKKSLYLLNSILKNPKLLKKTQRNMNFDNLDIYDFNSQKPFKTKMHHNVSTDIEPKKKQLESFLSSARSKSIMSDHQNASRHISPSVSQRSRVFHSRFVKLSSLKTSDPIRFDLNQESIRRILEDTHLNKRKSIFQKRNHSVFEHASQKFDISEINHTKDNIDTQ